MALLANAPYVLRTVIIMVLAFLSVFLRINPLEPMRCRGMP